MECKRIEELLSSYMEGELSSQENNVVAVHLESCHECAELLKLLKETTDSLAGFPELNIQPELQNRLARIAEKKKPLRLNLDFLVKPSLQPVFAAATVFLIVFSLYFFNPEKSQINNSLDRQINLGRSKVERVLAKAESFTSSLGAYKTPLLKSMKDFIPFGGNEE